MQALSTTFLQRVCAILALALTSASAFADGAKLTARGWLIEGDALGTHLLAYPQLTGGDVTMRPAGDATVSAEGDKATVNYDGGATLEVTLKDGQSRLHFAQLPDNAKKMKLEMTLPISLGGKATFSVDGAEAKPFPQDKPDDAFLYKGNGKKLAVAGNDGGGFAVAIEYGYQQLQDNRVWNDNKFYWMAVTDLPRVSGDQAYYTLKFPDGSAATPATKPAEPVADEKEKPASELKIALTAKGVQITAGSAGAFLLGYPKLEGIDPQTPTDVANADAAHTTLTYTDGTTADVRLAGGELVINFAGIGDAKKMRLNMDVPFIMSQGGKYAPGDDKPKDFPAEKPDKPFLYQGNANAMTFHHPTGPGFRIEVPKYSYQQLQDNREWHDNKFTWWFSSPLPSGNRSPSFTIVIGDPKDGATAARPVIDRFGQWIDRDFPGKVRSEDELKQDLEADRAYYASLNPPATDAFGGFPGTGEKFGLQKTGFFHLEKIGDADVLVTPEGNAFFHLGVCGISPVDEYTMVAGREAIYEWLPKPNDPTFASAWRPNHPGVFSFHLANVIRKTGKPHTVGDYAATWIERERKWGFNSLGAFAPTGPGPVRDELVKHNFPYVNSLPLSGLEEVPGATKVWDPFAPGVEQKIEQQFAENLPLYAADPLLIGSFITNEPSVEDVPKVVPNLKASQSPSKQRLTERLQEKYGDVAAFNRAWNLNLPDFDAVGEAALVVSTAEAAADVQAFFAEFLDRRYGLVDKYFRQYDPNHLLIGDRWMPGTSNNELMVRTAGKYLDVVSINYYSFDLDTAYLGRIHDWSGGKPIILSEFYFTSPSDSGLSGGMRMDTQQQRGLAYRHYVEHAAAIPYIVGVEWFINIDQASTGRFFQQYNGEANNTGLVDGADRPYKDFLAEVMKTNYDILPVLTGQREPFRLDDERFRSGAGDAKKSVSVSRMVETFQADGARSEWPGVPASRVESNGEAGFGAEFRLAWDDDNLYVYAEVADPTPMRNEQDAGAIWNGDAVELFVGVDQPEQRGTMLFSDRQVLIRGAESAGKPMVYFGNAPQQHGADVKVVRQLDGKGYIVEAAIPFAALGFEPRMHQEILFDLAIDDGAGDGRFRQLVFNGTRQASKDRGVWGRAQLVP